MTLNFNPSTLLNNVGYIVASAAGPVPAISISVVRRSSIDFARAECHPTQADTSFDGLPSQLNLSGSNCALEPSSNGSSGIVLLKVPNTVPSLGETL